MINSDSSALLFFFFFNDTATTEIYTLSLHDALPIYTPRPDLVAKYPTLPNAVQFRMPNIGFDVQKAAVEKRVATQFPLILTSGRLVEFEGGGEETRSNKWLAELQQDSFIEINPADAAARGIKDGAWGLVSGPEMASGKTCRMKALVTE